MALTLSASTTDTPVAGSPSTAVSLAALNYPADYLVKQVSASEFIITNKTCSVDQPEDIRISISDVTNIYSGSKVDPTMYVDTRRGKSILLSLATTMAITDTVDTTYRKLIPIQGHMVLKVPVNNLVTPDVVLGWLKRMFALPFETGSVTSARLNSLLRGSLRPNGL